MNYSGLVLFLAFFVGSAVSLTIEPGSAIELPTKLNEVKNEEIVYQHRSMAGPYDEILTYTIRDLDQSKPYEMQWMRGEDKLTISVMKETDAVPNSKAFWATMKEGSNNDLEIKLHVSDSVAKSGMYTLIIKQDDVEARASVAVNSAPILPTYNKPKRVLQGDSIRISCQVLANPLPKQIDWFFAPVNPESDSDAIANAYKSVTPLKLRNEEMQLVNEQGVEGDTLKFANLLYDDNGVYVCKASNNFGEDTTVVYLNIKNRWAALWPFIGVVIEVTVLVTAILLFERHQMRSKKPKSDPKTAQGNHVEAADKLNKENVDETLLTAGNKPNQTVENETSNAQRSTTFARGARTSKNELG